jgi:hypothetical protein
MMTFRVSKSVARTVPLTDRCIVAVGKWLRQRSDGGGSLWAVPTRTHWCERCSLATATSPRTHYAEQPQFVPCGRIPRGRSRRRGAETNAAIDVIGRLSSTFPTIAPRSS